LPIFDLSFFSSDPSGGSATVGTLIADDANAAC